MQVVQFTVAVILVSFIAFHCAILFAYNLPKNLLTPYVGHTVDH